MIHISQTTAGLLLQRDALIIQIDASAVGGTLGLIIVALVDSGAALAHARRAGYEDGLNQGYVNAQIASDTRARIEARQAAELVEALATVGIAQAA